MQFGSVFVLFYEAEGVTRFKAGSIYQNIFWSFLPTLMQIFSHPQQKGPRNIQGMRPEPTIAIYVPQKMQSCFPRLYLIHFD